MFEETKKNRPRSFTEIKLRPTITTVEPEKFSLNKRLLNDLLSEEKQESKTPVKDTSCLESELHYPLGSENSKKSTISLKDDLVKKHQNKTLESSQDSSASSYYSEDESSESYEDFSESDNYYDYSRFEDLSITESGKKRSIHTLQESSSIFSFKQENDDCLDMSNEKIERSINESVHNDYIENRSKRFKVDTLKPTTKSSNEIQMFLF